MMLPCTTGPPDAMTGLQNNLHRWYDPDVGRWLSEDPIGFAAGDANLYRYVGNESTGYVDPSGPVIGDASPTRQPLPKEKPLIVRGLEWLPQVQMAKATLKIATMPPPDDTAYELQRFVSNYRKTGSDDVSRCDAPFIAIKANLPGVLQHGSVAPRVPYNVGTVSAEELAAFGRYQERVYQTQREATVLPLVLGMSPAGLGKQYLGIPRSQQTIRQWTIRGPHRDYRSGATVRHPNVRHHGRVLEYKVCGPQGEVQYKYIVIYDQDPLHGGIGHIHAAESKLGPKYRLQPGEKYRRIGAPIPFDGK